ENLRLTGFAEDATAIRAPVERWLARTGAAQRSFSRVLCAPPYELDGAALGAVLGTVDAGWLAPEGWTVVVTRGHKSSRPVVPVHWALRRPLRYVDRLLTQEREEGWA